jgi:hypothetical protein
MKVVLFLVSICFMFSSGLYIYETGQNCPTLWERFWVGQNFPTIFNQNYSFILAPDGQACTITQNFAVGKLLLADAFSQTCANGVVTQNVVKSGAVALFRSYILEPIFVNQGIMGIGSPPSMINPPQLECSNMDIFAPWDLTYNVVNGGLLIFFNALAGMNQTAFLTPPTTNPLFINWLTPGSTTQFSFVCNFIISLCVLLVSCCKAVQFVHLQGIKVSLPQIVLCFAFLSGVVGLYLSSVGWWSWRAAAYSDMFVFQFFEYFCLGFAYTVCLLMGFYFAEISFLNKGGGFFFFFFFFNEIVFFSRKCPRT